MKKVILNKLNKIDKNGLSNTKKVAVKLLTAEGEWLPRSKFGKIPSVTSRIRDLRKTEYGAFNVECKRADELGKHISRSKKTYYYRINPSTVSAEQLDVLF